MGFGAGNNVGVKKAEGKYVLFLNPDTVLPKNALRVMYEFMERHKNVGAASPRLELASGKLDEASHRGFPTPWNAFCHFSGLRKLFPTSRIFAGYTMGWRLDKKKPHEVDSVSGAFFFVRRVAGEEVSWWDEDYFWYGDELDFCYRLKEKRWKIMFVPQITVLHYRGVASGIKGHSRAISTATQETRVRAAYASTEAMRIFYKKHYMNKYPRAVTWLTLLATNLLSTIRQTRHSIF
ncbi:MAG: glycosyltransferase family 2 protein [bacterium]|nr:glycosyltransferase family 2 protein [bacterium]